MYSEDDINSAVAAGALSEDAAASFRAHMTQVRGISRGDEENFKLLNSFNDIFVAIGICIMLFAAGAIGQQLGNMIVAVPAWDWGAQWTEAEYAEYQRVSGLSTAVSVALAAGLVALTSWPLAEFFTLRRVVRAGSCRSHTIAKAKMASPATKVSHRATSPWSRPVGSSAATIRPISVAASAAEPAATVIGTLKRSQCNHAASAAITPAPATK